MKIFKFRNFIFFKQTLISTVTVVMEKILYYSIMQLLQFIASATTTQYTSPNSYTVSNKRKYTGVILYTRKQH